MTYKSPKNKSQYWKVINTHWEDISFILDVYLPTFSKLWIDNSRLNKTLGEFLLDLKEKQNPRLIRAFNAAYWRIPDDLGLHSYPALNILYDLCVVEDFCLNEIQKEE